MSFFNNLGKGFVKSAVNQVGRDTGRQVSNAVFNDTAKSKTGVTVNISELTPVEESMLFKIAACVFLSFIIPIIGGFGYVIIGINNIFKSRMLYYRIESREVFVPDRRFKTGKRSEGFKDFKVTYEAAINEEKKKFNLTKGIIYIVIGVASMGFYFYVINEYVAP